MLDQLSCLQIKFGTKRDNAILEWNSECTTGRNQMTPSNTISIQGLRPDITDMSFEKLVKAKPDLPVFRLSDGIESQNPR